MKEAMKESMAEVKNELKSKLVYWNNLKSVYRLEQFSKIERI